MILGTSYQQVPARQGSGLPDDASPDPTSHSLPDYPKQQIPPSARMTKISRDLVDPEALRDAHLRFEEIEGFVIVSGVLDAEDIEDPAVKTWEIRGKPRQEG
jgi:hypothetical protein